MSNFELLNLPPELFERVCSQLCLTLDGPADLCRLCLSCRLTHNRICNRIFVAARGHERSTFGIEQLDQLWLCEALQNLGSNRVIFAPCETKLKDCASIAKLKDFTGLLLQHDRIKVTIDAHTIDAQLGDYARKLTMGRAHQIEKFLIGHDVCKSRISINGWGKDVALAAGWQAGAESAHAELYFNVAGLELPARPTFYWQAFSQQMHTTQTN